MAERSTLTQFVNKWTELHQGRVSCANRMQQESKQHFMYLPEGPNFLVKGICVSFQAFHLVHGCKGDKKVLRNPL